MGGRDKPDHDKEKTTRPFEKTNAMTTQKGTGSAYFLEEKREELVRHTLSILVDNEPGVLSRIAGLFSGRGYNIDSVTVSVTEHE